VLARAVDFVDSQNCRPSALPEHDRRIPIGRRDAGLRVNHQQTHVGLFDRGLDLSVDFALHPLLTLGDQAAGVDQRELATVPGTRPPVSTSVNLRPFQSAVAV
jgi:hypothetical protein